MDRVGADKDSEGEGGEGAEYPGAETGRTGHVTPAEVTERPRSGQ